MIPEAKLGVVFGASGSGKTFFMVWLVACIAGGVEWCGKRVPKARSVVYVASEDLDGVGLRFGALLHAEGLRPDDLPVTTVDSGLNLMKPEHAAELARLVRYVDPDAAIIVIDTLSRAMAGGDENAARDMGIVTDNCQAIARLTGAMVVLVHHTGKDEAKGARGHSSLKAAADFELEVVRSGDARSVCVTKVKNGQDGAEFGFRLEQVVVGLDEDGEAVTSCVVRSADVASATRRAVRAARGANQQLIMRALHDCPNPAGMFVNDLLEWCKDQLPAPAGKDRRREYLFEALEKLKSQNLLVADGDRIRRLEAPDGL